MKAIADEGGFEVQFEIVEWDGFITAIQMDRYDLGIYGVTITEERKKKIDFSDPYYKSGIIFMVNADRADLKTFGDILEKKIGTIRHTASEDYLRCFVCTCCCGQTQHNK